MIRIRIAWYVALLPGEKAMTSLHNITILIIALFVASVCAAEDSRGTAEQRFNLVADEDPAADDVMADDVMADQSAPPAAAVDNVDCYEYGAAPGLLGGLIKPSDHCFDDFISPMTNPVFFEDPRTLTEARFIFFNHWLPESLGGSDARLIAMQVRAALTDRLSIVAAKDGYIMSDAKGPLAGVFDDGWADVSLGLKYNLLVDPCCGRIVSVGVAYELPVGSRDALQGNGDGEFNIYITAGQRIGCDSHWLSASGFRLPVDDNAETTVWYWSNHLDHYLGHGVYAFGEANWYHWLAAGDVAAFNGIEGVDVINLGGTGVAGNDIVTGALGLKLKPCCNREIGVAYETHLTDRRGVFEDRLTVDLILRY